MSRRIWLPCFGTAAVLAVLVLAGQSFAAFGVGPRNPETELVTLIPYDIGDGYYLVWEKEGQSGRVIPLPEHDPDDFGRTESFSCYFPRHRLTPLEFPYWAVPGVSMLPEAVWRLPQPTVIHLSPDQLQQMLSVVNVGSHPVINLKSPDAVRRIEVTEIRWADWMTQVCWPGFAQQPSVVEIGEVQVAEPPAPSPQVPLVLIYAEDEERTWTHFGGGGHVFEANVSKFPPMPPDSPNWVIPGVLPLHLVVRPVPSPDAPKVDADYVFAKPNGDIIEFSRKMAKSEAKDAEGTVRKAFGKRYRETDDEPVGMAKGD